MVHSHHSEKDAIKHVIESYISAYHSRDIEHFLPIFSASESHQSFGTGKDEHYIGRSNLLHFIKRDFAQSDSAQLSLSKEYIVVHNDMAWAAVEILPSIELAGSTHHLEVLRGTFVFAKENGHWVIEHCHASWPHPEQGLGNAFPALELVDKKPHSSSYASHAL